MIRHLTVARDTAVKARSQAMLTLKAIIVSAPSTLREQLGCLAGKMTLLRHLAVLRPGPLTSTTASAKTSLRAIARRSLALNAEIKDHDAHLEQLTQQLAPDLVQAHGMGAGTAAEMLIVIGDNPERIRSEAALAKFCDACPIPASSGKTNRHRLNRGGNRQANAALYRVVIVRMRGAPAHPRLRQTPHRRRKEQTRDHSLPQAFRGPRNLRLSLPAAMPTSGSPRSPSTDIGFQSPSARLRTHWPSQKMTMAASVTAPKKMVGHRS